MPQDSQLNQWLARLEQLHPTEIELGLTRVRSVAERLNLLNPSAKIITIAGTNGKGSTVAAMQALLLNASGDPVPPRVGSYTSPHLFRFNERIQVNGYEAEDEIICHAFEAIDSARAEISLTYFEFATLAALWVFQKSKVDCIILEVGLGGRLDAVNILDADVAIITSIALDHQDWLGDTLDKIGVEKGGILRDRQSVIFGQNDMPAALMALADEKVQAGATLCIYDEKACKELLGDIEESKIPLIPSAWWCALQACKTLGAEIDHKQLTTVMQGTHLPGRMSEHRYSDRIFICDVAHNPAAIQRLVDRLEAQGIKRLVTIFSAMADKSIQEMIDSLSGHISALAIPDLQQTPRAIPATELANQLVSKIETGVESIEISQDMQAAINWAIQATQPGDKILVVGSFITVGECMSLLEQ